MAFARGIRPGRAFVELFALRQVRQAHYKQAQGKSDDSKSTGPQSGPVRGLRRAEKRLEAFGDRIRNMGLKIAGLSRVSRASPNRTGITVGDIAGINKKGWE